MPLRARARAEAGLSSQIMAFYFFGFGVGVGVGVGGGGGVVGLFLSIFPLSLGRACASLCFFSFFSLLRVFSFLSSLPFIGDSPKYKP